VLSEAALRSEIESERARISQLKDKIGDEALRLLLQSAAGTLAFAQIGFLDEKIMERQRTPAELAAWLGQAERHLARATQMRQEVEEAVAQRGASVPEFDETSREAFEKVCQVLQLDGTLDDAMTELVATKIIELAKAGEIDPERLCSRVLLGLAERRGSAEI
jgi:hypothetical protein